MKKLFFALAIVFALAAPMFAQSTFADVPRDHWAYDAVSELESLGLVIGYPDGEFKGKRTLTRYEFAMVLCRLLPFLGEDGVDVSGFVKKSDLDKYMLKDDYKPGTDADLSGLATADALAKIQALVDEFADELAALGVDVNVLKADVAALKSRVAALEDEQARVKITGIANFMVESVISGDEGADYDGLAPITKLFKRHQSFYKDVQIDVKGRVNDHVNVYTTLVMGDWMDKLFNGEAPQDTMSDIVPYYMYATSNDETWGDIRVGRMPFQINKFVFKRAGDSSYFGIDRLDAGNLSVEGFDYAKSFGAFDARVWGIRPVYDWNDPANPKFLDYGTFATEKVSGFGGIQLGVNFGDGRVSALYGKMGAENKIPFSPDKADIYGASLYVPFGQFYVDGGWYTAKPNKGYEKAAAWDANLGFDNDKLAIGGGYRTVESGYNAVTANNLTCLFDTKADNYKGFYGNVSYRFTDAFRVYGDYQDYEIDDAADFSAFEDARYFKAGMEYDLTDLDNIYVEYEQGKFNTTGIIPISRKIDCATLGWNRKVGQNAKIKMFYEYWKDDNFQKSHFVGGQLTVNF
ncbi:MAG: S-layer homology domain-containing protein [Abditibacteriota bacterium]|nr:S-layer homology domain-containing protein [Abditibacteriota bacterium]